MNQAKLSWMLGLSLLAALPGCGDTDGGVDLGSSALQAVDGVVELADLGSIDHRLAPVVDVGALLREDAQASGRVATRIAAPLPLAASLDDAGTWEVLPDGRSLWRLQVSSPQAEFLSFKLSELALPLGAELYFVSTQRDQRVGPFTQKHEKPSGRFGSPMIAGDSVVIALYLPVDAAKPRLTIESVSHGYRDAMNLRTLPLRGFGEDDVIEPPTPFAATGSLSCQRNINCPEGAAYQVEKHASSEGYDGQYICSGQLVNNEREDQRYLYLTAEHCQFWIDPPTMVYYWNYENSGCATNNAPLTFSTGSTELFHSQSPSTDVQLLELDGTDLEGDYDISFLGWSRSTTPPTSAATFGYPNDFPLQIAVTQSPLTDCSVGSCPSGFGPEYWRVGVWNIGMTAVGSSGGGLLDQNNRLVGMLTGGIGSTCGNFQWDEFSPIVSEWSSLQPFLDPDATGVLTVDTNDGQSVTPGVDVVTIQGAMWKAALSQLTVFATSSAQPTPTLLVQGFGPMKFKSGKYQLRKGPVPNPGTVTVKSSLGGSAVATIVVN